MDSKQFRHLVLNNSLSTISDFRGISKVVSILEDARIDPRACLSKHAAVLTNTDDGELTKKVSPYKSHPFMEKQLGSTIEEYCKDKINFLAQSTISGLTKLDYSYVGKDILDSLYQDIFTYNNKDFLVNKNRLLHNENTKNFALDALKQEFQKDNLAPLLTGINLNILFTNLNRLVESLMDDGEMFSEVFTKPIENYIHQNVHSFSTPIDAPVLEDNGFYKLIQNATTNLTEKDPLYADDVNNVLLTLTTLVNTLVKSKEVMENRAKQLENLIKNNLFVNFPVNQNHDNTRQVIQPIIELQTLDVITLEQIENITKKLEEKVEEYNIYINNILYPFFYYKYESKVIMFVYHMIFSILKEMNVGLSRFNLTSKIV